MLKPFLFILTAVLCACNNDSTPTDPTKISIPVENIVATKDQQDRRLQSENYCKAHGVPIYTNPTALFVDAEERITLRQKNEVVDRVIALCFIELKSEQADKKMLDDFDKHYNATKKLSPKEKAFMAADKPTQQQVIDANWRSEGVHELLWALGYIDSLNYPDSVCNVAEDFKFIFSNTEQQFRDKAKLRSKKEILDQADLILRLDWACVNARVKKEKAPAGLDPSIVVERHYAVNWLIRFLDEEWDDVSTDT